ncbi:hypothetical protein GF402_11335 [Candidatus Fermentibacteria bacterium]|nr:hypothetical protein [Candidatus Fermentibacteria bacterium]
MKAIGSAMIFGLLLCMVGVAYAGEQDSLPPVSDLALEMSCKSNMRTLATALSMYLSEFGTYPDSLPMLTDAGVAHGVPPIHLLECPACDSVYLYLTDGESFTLVCPCDSLHGSIVDGTASW